MGITARGRAVLGAALTVVSLLSVPFSAQATGAPPPASASASLDWSTFTVTPFNLGYGIPILTWTVQTESVSANTDGGISSTDSASDWTTDITAESWGSHALATAGAGGPTTLAEAGGPGMDGAYAGAEHPGEFAVSGLTTGFGLLVFAIDYALDISLDTTGPEYDAWGSTYAGINASLFGSPGTYASASDALSTWPSIGDNTTFFGHRKGVLQFGLLVTPGATGSFQAYTSSDVTTLAAVPVPPAVWLMGGALIGLVGIARRRGA
jgi:hypothetical protein